MNGEDSEGYDLLMEDIDAIAKQLLVLQEAGVPVLWRPLHEASGGWFWWGASGAEAYKELYVLLYDKLTNEYGLNNLIWLWNGQDAEWYPGDEYVDIIGEDIYPGEQVYTSQIAKFLEATEYTEADKMVVLSENGCIFDPDLAIRDGAMWGFFATWGGEIVSKSGGLNIYSEQYTDIEMLKKVYAHESVLTLDELPDLKTYEIRKDAE
jgi:mannan endo-1,4-beta-mannosidase